MLMTIVRFKSGLSDEAVMRLYDQRLPQYREVPGLLQKYYMRYHETGEHGGVFIWESEAALEAFRASPLAQSIADVYKAQDTRRHEVAEIVRTLR